MIDDYLYSNVFVAGSTNSPISAWLSKNTMIYLSATLCSLERFSAFIKQLDVALLILVNQLAHHSWYLDKLVIFIDGNSLIKSGLIVSALWWLWFAYDEGEKRRQVREQILLIIFIGFCAVFFARFLAFILPFRTRPLVDPTLKVKLAFDLEVHSFWSWSGFPSDHAVLFSSLAMGIWYISKKLGWIVMAYVFVLICLPRIYLGIHYPADIMAGFGLGVGMAWLGNTVRVYKFLRSHLIVPVLNFKEKSPGPFYACLFLLSYQIADLFDQIRSIGGLFFYVFKHLIGR
jgi:undecaprenyl-diphosphatase